MNWPDKSEGGAGPAAAGRGGDLPANSPEAERGVLGCCLLSPADCIGDVFDAINGDSSYFYSLVNRTVWEELSAMYSERAGIDLITIQQRLKDKGTLDGIGGLTFLASLPDATPSHAHLGYYLSILREKRDLRVLETTCLSVISSIRSGASEAEKLIDCAERDMMAAFNRGESSSGNRKDSFRRVTETLEQAYLNKGKMQGMSTGMYRVDRILGGLRNGTMNVIAARPGLGKSTMGYSIAEFNAKAGTPVGYFSMEMSEDELNMRSLCTNSSVNSRLAMCGELGEREMVAMTKQIVSLSKLPIHICDRSDMTILRIRSEARRMFKKSGVKLIVVDYIQLVSGSNKHGRREDVDEISRGIKGMAKELGIPVVALAQLNREIDKDAGRRPRLSDLRESGGIEQDADSVSFIYCPDDTKIQDDGSLPVKFSTQKNRNGDIGECDLLFERALTRFTTPSMIERQS